jgi:hypothetical protein
MTRFARSTAVLTLGLALIAGAVLARSPSAFGTEVSVAPSEGGVYLLKAKVTDLGSGELLAGPVLKFRAGDTGEAETTLPDGQTTVHLRATVSADGRTADYKIEIRQGETLLASHSGQTVLQ